MITTNVSGMGNFYVTADNPAGPWSDPVVLPEIQGIDPSFFLMTMAKPTSSITVSRLVTSLYTPVIVRCTCFLSISIRAR